MIRALDTSSSALVAQRVRMDVIAGNIANAFTTAQEDGRIEPYRRRVVTFAPTAPDGGSGVQVASVTEDPSPFRAVYDPGHPHAVNGVVQLPNVSITMEYVDALAASRAYEANLAILNVSKRMVEQAIRLFA